MTIPTGASDVARYSSGSSPRTEPAEPPPPGRLARWADRLRALFDRAAARTSPVFVVAACAALAAGALQLMRWVLTPACTNPPVSLVRLEVTYSAPRFAALLRAEGKCREEVIASFWPDMLFPATYALLLAAVFVWAERWRRFAYPAGELVAARARRRDLAILAPFAAALLDIVAENVPLLIAARAVPGDGGVGPGWLGVAVVAGSLGATLKFLLLFFCIWELGTELMRGPRGLVLRRLRFSALAVVLGAFPLLAIAQGQDILQRLVEGEHPWVRIVFAVAAIAFGATAIWYCGRRLVQLRFARDADDGERREARESTWYDFFARHIPRLLGVAALALAGAAFARAGLALGRFVIVAGVGFLVVIAAERWAGRVLEAIGRLLAPRELGGIEPFVRRIGSTVVAAAAGALAFWPHTMPWADELPMDAGEHSLRALRVAAWLCLVAAWVFYLFVYFRRERAAGKRKPLPAPYDSQSEIPRGLRLGIVLALVVSLAVLLVFALSPVRSGRLAGPVWVVTLAVVNAVFFGSIAVWIHERHRFPVVRIGLALALLFSLWNDNHRVRTITAPESARVPLATHLDDWIGALPAPTDSGNPVILVAAAGGGLRAGYWTAIALAALQDSNPAFARRNFAISSVSGGSLGATLFTALARDAAGDGARLACAAGARDSAAAHPYSTCVRRFMADDFLSPLLAKTVAPDFAQRFLPIPIRRFDRAIGLERSWEHSYRAATGSPTFSRGLRALAGDSSARDIVPALLLNTTHVETGRRYVASAFALDSVLHDGVDLLGLLNADMRLSTAVHNSARFPFVSPAGHLDRRDGEELGRVVDGGYFENSGLVTLREVLALLRERSRSRGASALRPVVLYLCNDPVSCRAGQPGDTSRRTPSTAANELLAPLRALLHTREARGTLATTQMRMELGDDFVELDVCDSLTIAPELAARVTGDTSAAADTARMARTRERVVSPPLGWLLSRLAREWMDSSLTGSGPAISACRARNVRNIERLRVLLATGGR